MNNRSIFIINLREYVRLVQKSDVIVLGSTWTMRDLTNQWFGRLVALRPTEERRNRSCRVGVPVYCGNITYTVGPSLTRNASCIYIMHIHEAFELLAQWDQEKNGSLTPQDGSKGRHRKIWWKCPEGHVWQALICSRTGGKNAAVLSVPDGWRSLSRTDMQMSWLKSWKTDN